MAILKNIPIHARSGSMSRGLKKGVSDVVTYIDNKDKNMFQPNFCNIDRVLAYDMNNDKTLLATKYINKQLVTYLGTSRSTVAVDFEELSNRYYETHNRRSYKKHDNRKQKKEIVAFHFVQSFEQAPYEVDPQMIHGAGVKLLKDMGYIGVVSTHLDTDNIHNHILICPFPEKVNGKKLIMNRTTWRETCRLNDEICKEIGMPTLGFERTYNRRSKYRGRNVESYQNAKPSTIHKDELVAIFDSYAQKKIRHEFEKGIPQTDQRSYELNLYDDYGRRRTVLELLLLRLIILLKMIRDALIEAMTHEYQEQIIKSMNERSARIQSILHKLEKQLAIASQFESISDLKKAKRDVGKSLTNAKQELIVLKNKDEYYRAIEGMIDAYNKLHKTVGEYIDWNLIPTYTKIEVQKEIANRYPPTNSQKKEMYKLIKKQEDYKIDSKWDTLNYDEVRQIIEFLSGKSKEKPNRLIEKHKRIMKEEPLLIENGNKNIAWFREFEVAPDALKNDIEQLHNAICDLRKIGIDPATDNLLTVSRGMNRNRNEMYRVAAEIETLKNEYIELVRIENVIIEAKKTIQNEQNLVKQSDITESIDSMWRVDDLIDGARLKHKDYKGEKIINKEMQMERSE